MSLRSTLSSTSLQMNRKVALRMSTPGNSPASVSTWKPLQMPSTGVPALARRTTSRITGE